MPQDFKTITYEVTAGVARLTLNRPQTLNSLNKLMLDELAEVLSSVDADPAVRVLTITGAGRGFCAGADLVDSAAGDDPGLSRGQRIAEIMRTHFNPVVLALRNLKKPTLAAVNGVAAGGGMSLALAADLVIAAKGAAFIQVFAPRLALVPDMGATWMVPRLIGAARARGLALLGDRVSADQAQSWGLIWQVVPDNDLEPVTRALAERLAQGPTQTFARVKEGLDLSEYQSFEQQLEWERLTQGVLADRPEADEGVRAFIEKRDPKF